MKILRSSNSYYRSKLMQKRKHKPLKKPNKKKPNRRKNLTTGAKQVLTVREGSAQEKPPAPKGPTSQNKREQL